MYPTDNQCDNYSLEKKRKKIVEKCFKYHFFYIFVPYLKNKYLLINSKLYVLDIRTGFLLK